MERVETRSVDDWVRTLGWVMLSALMGWVDAKGAAALTNLIIESIDAQPTNLITIKLDDATNIPLSHVDHYQAVTVSERQ